MREPWEAKDFKRVGQLAHQWKGTCSYLSAKRAQRAALRLEQGAKALAEAGDSEYLATHLDRMKAEQGGRAPSLLYNEFIVYDTQQIKQKYVLRVKFKFQQRY